MANTLKLEIITPDSKVFDGPAEFVELPGAEGDMGVFPLHETMLTELKAGELRITHDGKVESLAIGGLLALKTIAIPRGQAVLGVAFLIMASGGAPGEQGQDQAS